MAKHNQVFLYGIVARTPKIFKNPNTGEFATAYCPVTVIRGNRDSGSDILSDIRYDSPIILSNNPQIIETMSHWEVNDMVEVKGVITTKNMTKKATCTCGCVNKIEGSTLTYVTPIYVSCRETNISKEEGIRLLKKRIEISNQVNLIGYLATDPDYYRTPSGVDVTQYPLAVKRKFRIIGDDPANKVDYPWIKSFDKVAREDGECLRKSSLIFVDGMIQTREFKRKTICNQCEKEFEWTDSAVEIVSYANEYLSNYMSQEEIDKKKESETESMLDELLS